MSNTPGDLKLTISADVKPAQNAIAAVGKEAEATGKVASVNLSKIEKLLEGINDSAQKTAASLSNAFKQTGDVSRYEAQINKLTKQLDEQAIKIKKLSDANDQYARELRAVADAASKNQSQLEKLNGTASRIEGGFARATKGILQFGAALGGIATAQRLGSSFIQLSDESTRLDGRLKLVTNSTQEFSKVQTELFNISQRTRSEFGSNVELYTRSAQSLKQLGATATQTLQVTELLNQAFSISGATTAEASGAIIQLSQAFSAGALRGEEFNSIAESGPRIMQALADALGVTRGQLRKLAEDGKLTSKLVFDALLSQAPKIAAEFSKVPRTVSQAMTQLGNDMLRVVGQTNQATGATNTLVTEIDRLREIVTTSDFGGTLTGVVREVVTFISDTRNVYNQLSTVFDQLKSSANTVGELFASSLGAVGTSANGLQNIVRGTIGKTVEYFTLLPSAALAAKDAIMAGWNNFPDALAGVVVEAARRGLLAIEELVDGAISLLNNGITSINEALGTSIGRISGVQGTLSGYLTEYANKGASQAAKTASETFSRVFNENQKGAKNFLSNSLASIGIYVDKSLNPFAQTAQEAAFAIRDLDASQGALTATQSNASIETQKLNVDLSDNTKELEKAEKITQRYNKGVLDRVRGIQDTVKNLEMETALFGQSEGTIAAATFQYQALEAAKRAAADAKRPVSQEEIDAINSASGQIQVLTDNLKLLNEQKQKAERLAEFEEDLNFKTQIRGLSQQDQQIAERLRSVGVDYLSIQGQQYAAQMKYNDALKQTNEGIIDFQDLGESAFDVLNDSLREGTGLLGGLMNMFAKLANQLASQAFGKLFGGLFNPGQQTGVGSGGGSVSPILTALGTGSSSSGSRAIQPIIANDNKALSKLNTSLNATSKSAIDVARQFNGLNEKANAPVLDSFLRASGTWKNLSAKDTAWCAAFANAAIAQTGGKGTGSNLASSFMNWGTGTNAPKPGDIVVLKPQSSGASGHVGFLAGFKDGKVQIFGGNQSNGANTKSFGLDQVRSYRTDNSLHVSKQAVSEGLIDAQRKITTGQAGAGLQPSTVTAWSSAGDMRTVGSRINLGGGAAGGARPSGWNGMTGAGSILGVEYPAFSAMGGISAGLGGFSSGYSSGSPASGALTGALSGFMSGGPVGALIGGAAGLLGGALGGRAKRKEEHKAAAAKWEEMRPQYEAFDRSLSGEKSGDLRKYITDGWGQLNSFMQVGGAAWKMGTGNSSAQFNSTGKKLFEGFLDMLKEFQEGFDDMVDDLASGQGLEGSFAKGRNAAKALSEQVKKTQDDIDIAFGNIGSIDFLNTSIAQEQAKETEKQRAEALERFNKAAGEYALSLLYTERTVSDVEKTVDGLRGTAAGLQGVLEDLGWSAEDASKAIGERLNRALANMRSEFEKGITDRINDLNGKGYFAETREMIKEFEQLQKDASILGADQSNFAELFRLQSQSIVDGSELTGEAFAELIKAFPQLSGVVKEFVSEAVKASEAEIKSALDSYEERLFAARNVNNELAIFDRKASQERIEAAKFGTDALAKLEQTLAAERANVALSVARNNLDRAYQAETTRISKLVSQRQKEASELETSISSLESYTKSLESFRKSMLTDEDVSTLSPYQRFLEAQKQFRDTAAKAAAGDEDAQAELANASQRYLEESRSYYASSESYYASFEEVRKLITEQEATAGKTLTESQRQLEALKTQIDQAEKELELLEKQNEAILGLNDGIKSLSEAMREYAKAANDARNQGIPVGGSSKPGNVLDGITPNWNENSASQYLSANKDVAAAIAAGETFGLLPGFNPEVYASAHFGLYGKNEGRTYASGGLISGPGTGTSDSIMARVSNGEFVTRAASVNTQTRGMLEYINRNGVVPNANDNSRMEGVERRLDRLTQTVAAGFQMNNETGMEGNKIASQQVANTKLAGSR